MIEATHMEQFIKSIESPMQYDLHFHCCKVIGQALSYTRRIPKEFPNNITYETFFKELNLPSEKILTKKDFRKIQKELSKRIIEELSSPTYIVGSIGAFEYFSLFHALRLLGITSLEPGIPQPEHGKNFAYNLAYGLFIMDDGTNVFPYDEYFVCNQFDWAVKAATEKMTEK